IHGALVRKAVPWLTRPPSVGSGGGTLSPRKPRDASVKKAVERDAIWILNKTVFENVEEKRISKEHIVRTIKKLVVEYMPHQLTLTENQRKAIKLLRDFRGSKEQLVSELQRKGIKRTTAYSIIEQLMQKKILLVRNGLYQMSGKFRHVGIDSLF
ncbi:MAG: hypothetical protein PWQ90_1604, partial [Pseudothermotoga sp.]|nr:hypothetical protein [Pseudothermotoga sp.]